VRTKPVGVGMGTTGDELRDGGCSPAIDESMLCFRFNEMERVFFFGRE
jgi:hypothetical protein